MMDKITTHDPESPLVKALEERERETWEFEAKNLMGIAGKPLGSYKVRVATKAEQDQAIVLAHDYAIEIAGAASPAARDDDILREAKTAHLLHVVCRDAKQPDVFSAFPSPRWMMQNLSTDELAMLTHNYNAVLGKCGVFEMDTSDERIEAYLEMCATTRETDIPDMVLAACNREYLIYLVIRAAEKLADARHDVMVRDAELAASVATPEADGTSVASGESPGEEP